MCCTCLSCGVWYFLVLLYVSLMLCSSPLWHHRDLFPFHLWTAPLSGFYQSVLFWRKCRYFLGFFPISHSQHPHSFQGDGNIYSGFNYHLYYPGFSRGAESTDYVRGDTLDYLIWSGLSSPTMASCKLESLGNWELLSLRSWKPQNKRGQWCSPSLRLKAWKSPGESSPHSRLKNLKSAIHRWQQKQKMYLTKKGWCAQPCTFSLFLFSFYSAPHPSGGCPCSGQVCSLTYTPISSGNTCTDIPRSMLCQISRHPSIQMSWISKFTITPFMCQQEHLLYFKSPPLGREDRVIFKGSSDLHRPTQDNFHLTQSPLMGDLNYICKNLFTFLPNHGVKPTIFSPSHIWGKGMIQSLYTRGWESWNFNSYIFLF